MLCSKGRGAAARLVYVLCNIHFCFETLLRKWTNINRHARQSRHTHEHWQCAPAHMKNDIRPKGPGLSNTWTRRPTVSDDATKSRPLAVSMKYGHTQVFLFLFPPPAPDSEKRSGRKKARMGSDINSGSSSIWYGTKWALPVRVKSTLTGVWK